MNRRQLLKTLLGGVVAIHQKDNILKVIDGASALKPVALNPQIRTLKAGWSIELAQDLKSIHGLDAEEELKSILGKELLADIDREIKYYARNR